MNIANKLRKINNINTVFTIVDIKKALNIKDQKSLYNAIHYAVKQEELYTISKGIYSFDSNYSRKEFGNKYRTPSYISLYTVLQESGIVFQLYTSIFVITNRSQSVDIDGQKYVYRKIKDEILLNPLGIEQKNGVSTAIVERAICDKIYLDGIEYFDNLRNIDLDLIGRLNREVYGNNKDISKFLQFLKNESIEYKGA
jgi:predicted transcriptional regulator of viral defense system